MKNVLLVLMLVFGASVFGQNKNAKAVIAVDGVCMMCKDRIEKASIVTIKHNSNPGTLQPY